MSLSEKQLISLNKLGFIPGPLESEDIFIKRISYSKLLFSDPENFFSQKKISLPFNFENKVKKPLWSWSKKTISQIFDIAPENYSAFFSNKKLSFFEGASTWILPIEDNLSLPVLQFRKTIKTKNYLGIYSFEEILAHEAVHMARVAFEDSKYEEIFAYLTSSSSFRRTLGAVIQHKWEVLVFFSFVFSAVISQFMFLNSLSIFLWFCSFLFLSLGLIRLFFLKLVLKKAHILISKYVKNNKKALFVLFRCSDEEIKMFSKISMKEFTQYVDSKKHSSIRWKIIYNSYLKN
jgi:hypothetical protein